MERVELAYARHVLGRADGHFCRLDPWGRFSLLARSDVAAWLAGGPPPARLGHAALLEVAGRPGAVFSILAHHGLHRRGAIAAVRRRGARFVPAVHDLIPLEWPETTRWLQRRMTRARMRAVGQMANAVLVFSETVRQSLCRFCAAEGFSAPPMQVAPLAVDLPPPAAVAPAGPPYFLCVANIELRKNHGLLLDAWQLLGPAAPDLIIVGRRSFGARKMLARLDAGAFRGVIEERGHCPDAELASLLAGARALLLPTLAEGFGIPVAEALSAGVPVICSDIPALREVGRGVPEFLSPGDPAGWAAAVAAYAAPESSARAAQLARLAGWRGATWAEHFSQVEYFLAGLASGHRIP